MGRQDDKWWLIPRGRFVCPRCGDAGGPVEEELEDRLSWSDDGKTVACWICDLSAPPEWYRKHQGRFRTLWNAYRDAGRDGDRYAWFDARIRALKAIQVALLEVGYDLTDDDKEDLAEYLAALPKALLSRLEKRLREAKKQDDPRVTLRALHELHQHRTLTARELRLVGELLAEIGDKAQAARAWRKALALDPKVGVRQKLTQLEKELAAE